MECEEFWRKSFLARRCCISIRNQSVIRINLKLAKKKEEENNPSDARRSSKTTFFFTEASSNIITIAWALISAHNFRKKKMIGTRNENKTNEIELLIKRLGALSAFRQKGWGKGGKHPSDKGQNWSDWFSIRHLFVIKYYRPLLICINWLPCKTLGPRDHLNLVRF